MSQLTELSLSLWSALNYPFLKFGNSSVTLWAILLNLGLIVIFLIVINRAKGWILNSLEKRKGVDLSNWRAVITLSYYAFLAVGLMAILQSTGLDMSLFTVLTGAIGIGVGFGMQSIFSNFISGIIILLEKPLKLGDRIEVGEVSGNVSSISVRATTITTNDNVSIIVPNSDFISKQLINWSYSGTTVRIRIKVSVSYDSDPEMVQRLLLEVAHLEPGVLKSPAPDIRLTEFGESGLNFQLLIWTSEYHDRMGALKSLINLSILRSFKAHGVRMPFPQRDVHIQDSRPLPEFVPVSAERPESEP